MNTRDIWKEAVEEYNADTEGPTSEESAEEEPTSEESAEGSAAEVAGDYSDINWLASRVLENPETAVAELKKFQRHLDGRHGTEISKLRQELQIAQAQVAAELARLRAERTPVSSSTSSPDEPDAEGLTQKDYERLGAIFDKTPQRLQEKTQAQQNAVRLAESELSNLLQNVKKEQGEFFTSAMERRLTRVIRLSGYNLQNQAVNEECADIIEEIKVAQAGKKGKEIEKEQTTRTQVEKRAGASIERPSSSPIRTDDVDITDGKGHVTPKSMAKAAKVLERRLGAMR